MKKTTCWHIHPTYRPTLFFTKQPRPGWSPDHRGDYILCFPSWYCLDKQGVLHRVGLATLGEEKATTTVASWREDLEALLCGPLESGMQAFRAQLPFTVITRHSKIPQGPLYIFPVETYVLVGHYLYRTDRRGYLCLLGECSVRDCKTVEDFRCRVQQLTGIAAQIQIHARRRKVVSRFKSRSLELVKQM
jgi:hypothetical protein